MPPQPPQPFSSMPVAPAVWVRAAPGAPAAAFGAPEAQAVRGRRNAPPTAPGECCSPQRACPPPPACHLEHKAAPLLLPSLPAVHAHRQQHGHSRLYPALGLLLRARPRGTPACTSAGGGAGRSPLPRRPVRGCGPGGSKAALQCGRPARRRHNTLCPPPPHHPPGWHPLLLLRQRCRIQRIPSPGGCLPPCPWARPDGWQLELSNEGVLLTEHASPATLAQAASWQALARRGFRFSSRSVLPPWFEASVAAAPC